jgi:peptide/nickel transport system permease protein
LTAFIIRRLSLTVIVLIIISFFSFLLLYLVPGDPAAAALGLESTPGQVEAYRHELWLDRPFIVQYFHWVGNAVRGDFGQSIAYREPISTIFKERLPITLYLAFWAFILSNLLGVFAGVVCAIRRGGILDQTISVLANMGIAVPIFFLGILGIYAFALKLNWLPIMGWTSPGTDFVMSTKQAVMPVIALAIPGIAMMARQTRSSMLEVVRQDYVRTAWSKGLRERQVIIRHAMKNALIPIVTLMGLQIRILVGGSVIVEQVFNIPGMGRLLVYAAFSKDFLIIQAGVLIIGLIVCIANLLVDISYGWLDPRVRFE